jgi:hypothetical protein
MLAADAEEPFGPPTYSRRSTRDPMEESSMTATAQSIAVELPASAAAQSAAAEVPQPIARPVAPAAAPRRLEARAERWVYAFGLTLAGSLAFFLWQMAQYTTLVG